MFSPYVLSIRFVYYVHPTVSLSVLVSFDSFVRAANGFEADMVMLG